MHSEVFFLNNVECTKEEYEKRAGKTVDELFPGLYSERQRLMLNNTLNLSTHTTLIPSHHAAESAEPFQPSEHPPSQSE